MESWEPYISYAMALFSGLLIGLEREHSRHEQIDAIAGVRTTPLFALSACIAASLSPWAFLLVLASAVGLSIARYARNVPTGQIGLTSVGAFILTTMIGGLAGTSGVFASTTQKISAVAALSVVSTLLLSVKPQLVSFSSKISRDDVIATLKFLLIAVVVLPLLPDAPHGPWGILNPHKLGLMVSLLAGVSFVGYAASRVLGSGRGLVATGAIGGLVSSTAVTLSASKQTRQAPELADISALSIMVACTVMSVRVAIVGSVTNPSLSSHLVFPMGAMALGGIGYSVFLYRRSRHHKPNAAEPALANPFELGETLQMAALLVGVMLFSKWATQQFGQSAAYVTALFAGLADVDAITLSMARLAQTQELALSTAVAAIFLAVASNTVVKGTMSAVFGNGALAQRVALGFAIMMAGGAAGLGVATLLAQ